jgi:hypothetical protein
VDGGIVVCTCYTLDLSISKILCAIRILGKDVQQGYIRTAIRQSSQFVRCGLGVLGCRHFRLYFLLYRVLSLYNEEEIMSLRF